MKKVQIFGKKEMQKLAFEAQNCSRKRKNFNLHNSFSDPCQKLLNLLKHDSYIRPHNHVASCKDELLVCLKGMFSLHIFDENGVVVEVIRIASELHEPEGISLISIGPEIWHTVTCETEECLILEVKAGPFVASQAKNLAKWAPAEDADEAASYLKELRSNSLIKRSSSKFC